MNGKVLGALSKQTSTQRGKMKKKQRKLPKAEPVITGK